MNADGAATVVQHMCPLCEASCGLNVHLIDGDVSLIRGDPDDVFSHGFLGIVSGEGPNVDPATLDDSLVRGLIEADALGQSDAIIDALAPRIGADRRVDLGLRTGPYGDLFGLDPEGLCLDKVIAQPSGIDLGPLESRLPDVLRTPSGKIELAPTDFVDALAEAVDEIDDEIPPCVLIGRRHLRSNNSWMHNLATLAKGRYRCTLLVHPDDAERWDLGDGVDALLSSVATSASLEVLVEIDDAMMPGVVSLPHGWGHDGDGTRTQIANERPGVNINSLTDPDARDPLSGNAALNGIAVTLAPMPAKVSR